jgi:hypothetical protein
VIANSVVMQLLMPVLCCLLGSILSGGGSVPAPQASPSIWVNMVNEFQKGALSTRLGIPMVYGIDAVHGNNNVYNATLFPHNVGLGATRCIFDNLRTTYLQYNKHPTCLLEGHIFFCHNFYQDFCLSV